MDNNKKINLIHEIVLPYFKFELDDFYGDYFYGDNGRYPYPKIEELKMLHFKKKSRNEKGNNLPSLTKQDERIMIEKIKNLNIGKVDYYTIGGLGKYIELDIEVTDEEDIALRYF